MRSPLYSQRTLAGTLAYVSPEIILGQPYGRAVDIWVSIESPLQWLNAGSGFGGFVLEFVCGEEPFGADQALGARCKFLSSSLRSWLTYPISDSIEDLPLRCPLS